MQQTPHTIVICYDISRAKLRRKVACFLEERMVRVQKSVFEARLHLEAANRIFDYLENLIEDGDGLRMYVMQKGGLEKSRAAGGSPIPEDGSFWLL
ncbi:CRISPR-associated endonuclease Cas2 [uncultured Cohaesibacter sp.]|uniref:CRISPR-associated endonuclease Cas2 n=1 Tax=uncultured Cohaesibacter sp. TaxID=1002546 RepID=UPI002AA61C57|nr:CRISPR-associated endonuclease Cas2 [uncultured Cohaesibacter sp.]